MSKTQCYIGTPNGVVLCIDAADRERWKGRFYHAYSREPVEISSFTELVFELEKFYDDIQFPHRTTNGRSFVEKRKEVNPAQERKRVMKDEELLSRYGDLGTFIIRVQHRQNSSWQGRITWMDQDKTIYFRSIWELIKLIESALDTVSEDTNDVASWNEES